jgi:hypothetical protein
MNDEEKFLVRTIAGFAVIILSLVCTYFVSEHFGLPDEAAWIWAVGVFAGFIAGVI